MGNATGEQQKERRTGNKNGVQDRNKNKHGNDNGKQYWETRMGEPEKLMRDGHGKQELETIMVIKNGQQ